MKAEGGELSAVYSEYLAGEYKACLRYSIVGSSSLQKLAKQPGDKNFNVLHNLYIMEYILNRGPQQASTALGKLSDLVNEIKKVPQKAGKNKQLQEKDSKHDEGTLKYNMAIVAGCVGHRDNMEMILDEIYNSGLNQFSWRIGFLLLESQLLLDKKIEALEVIRKLHRTRFMPKKFSEEKSKMKFVGLTYPDSSGEYNYVCEQEYIYLLDVFRAQLAMKFGLVKTAGKLLPKRETARIFQGIRENVFVYKNTNLFELNLLSILKFTTAQCDYEEKRYQNALKMLSPHNLMEMEINFAKYLNFINHLALNNIGLINYKLEKYTLALYYISKSLENIAKTSASVADERDQLIVQHFQAKQEYLLVNQALVLLKLNKSKEAYEHFCRITKPSKSFKFWYRFGQAALEHYHELLVENGDAYESDLYDELHDNYDTTYSYPNLPYVKLHDDGKKKPGLNTAQRTPFYTRYILRRSDQFIQEESLEEDKKINSKQSKLLHLKPILSKAQSAFQNCYVCLSKIDIDKTLETLELKHIVSQAFVQDIEAEQQECHTKQMLLFQHNNFKQSSLLMLAYISLCKQQYPKTIKQCNELLQLSKLTEDNGYSASMFLVEAYLETQKYKEAIDVSLNQWLKLGQHNCTPIRCRDSLASSESHFDTMSPDNITRYNMAVLHIKGNNITQANNVIQQLLTDMGITVNSVSAKIPVPILNLLIYWNIRTDNAEIALQLIKRRRVLILPNLNNNKALLKITK